MVEIVNNNGITSIESTISVSEEIYSVVSDPKNRKTINNTLKDLDIRHRIENKNGNYLSIVGMYPSQAGRFSVEEAENVEKVHLTLLEALEDLIKDEKVQDEDMEAKPEEAETAEFDSIYELLKHSVIIIPIDFL